MQLLKTPKVNSKIKDAKTYTGLLACNYEYEIKSMNAMLQYTGPAIPPDVWHQILSYFRWTYETTHSECQVRLYVNIEKDTWAAWAYPQEARTGMTAKELDTEDTKTQRAQFPDTEGWIYFGTVHHHCSGGAFQSSTDEYNEKNQDGLHITIGKINDPNRHDMHCRFYLGGDMFEPNMALFWEIGEGFAKLLPGHLHNEIARHQMCAVIEAPFPDQWKNNLIEVKIETYNNNNYSTGYMGGVKAVGNGVGGHHGFNDGGVRGTKVKHLDPFHERADRAFKRIISIAYHNQYDVEDVNETLKSMTEGLVKMVEEELLEEGVDLRHMAWKVETACKNPLVKEALEEEYELEAELAIQKEIEEARAERLKEVEQTKKELDDASGWNPMME